MHESVAFHYIYRDARNFKAYHSVKFANPDALSLEEIERRFRAACDSGELFIAHQIHLPELFFEIDGRLTDTDYCYHQFDCVENTIEQPDGVQGRTITEFLHETERIEQSGWKAFDLMERL